MSFSLTGNILTGSSYRPDIVTFVHRTGNKITNCNSYSISKLNVVGYIPIVSTVTGLGRSLLGLAHTIAHLVIALFTLKKHHLREAGLGAQNFGRGLVEMVPILNLTMFFNDIRREVKHEKIARDHAMASDKDKTWGEQNGGQFAMYACGEFITSRPFQQVTGCRKTLGALEEALYGHQDGRMAGHPYLLPEYQPWHGLK